MLLKQVVRRNRRAQLLVLVAAWVNWWLLISLGFGLTGMLLRSMSAGEDRPPQSGTQYPDSPPTVQSVVVVCLGLGAAVAALVVVVQMARIRPRTIAKLGARPLAPDTHRRVVNLLEELAIATGTPPVAAAILDDKAPNAMAVGTVRSRTTIVVTSALLEHAARDELEAVLAVEMCAIQRLDTAMYTAILACTHGPIAVNDQLVNREQGWIRWPLALLSVPAMVAAQQLRRWGLRSNDFATDDMAIAITRNPDGLRRALRELKRIRKVVDVNVPATAPLWFEPIPVARQTETASGAPLTASLIERIERLPVA